MKTTQRTINDRQRQWHHVDADGQILGRLAVQIAMVLMGKHKPDYTPHIDTGDFVVVTNAEKIKVTGNKADQKEYQWYSGYHGGLKTRSYEKMLEKKPGEILRLAVKRMMPKNNLSRHRMGKLKVYAGKEHPHAAQQPSPFPIKLKEKK